MPAKRFRLAAIDVGTNSIHMIIVEAQRRGFRVIDREKEMVQLGRGSLEGNPLTPAAMERGIAALVRMAEIAQRDDVNEIVAVATSAVREAPNGSDFIRDAEKASGIHIRTISGEEEADYIYRAVRSNVDLRGGTALIIDIGGGSTELILGTEREVYMTTSEPVGVLRMAQKFLTTDPPSSDQIAACRRFVRKSFKRAIMTIRSLGFDYCIGTSGTINTLADLSSAQPKEEDATGVATLRAFTRSQLLDTINRLRALTADQRVAELGLDRRRADTILAGAVVLDEVLDAVRAKKALACPAALREGVVDRILDERQITHAGGETVRRASVLDLVERSGIDRVHANHVAKLATRIFDQTVKLHGLSRSDRELLEDAALLHEVGVQVSYQSYHKHTYYLVRHAGLRGFTEEQLMVVANIARYHRKKPLDPEHENVRELNEKQREQVKRLSAILRMADALDRGRRQVIRDVGVDVAKEVVTLYIRPRDEANVEIETANKQARHMARLYDRFVDIEVASD